MKGGFLVAGGDGNYQRQRTWREGSGLTNATRTCGTSGRICAGSQSQPDAAAAVRERFPAPTTVPISPLGGGHPRLTKAMPRQSYIAHKVCMTVRQTAFGLSSAPSRRIYCCQLASHAHVWHSTILPVVRRREGRRRPELFQTPATSPRWAYGCAGSS